MAGVTATGVGTIVTGAGIIAIGGIGTVTIGERRYLAALLSTQVRERRVAAI